MGKKSAELREAERVVERRRDDVIQAAKFYTMAHDAKGETRALLGDLRDAVRDLRTAESARDAWATKELIDRASAKAHERHAEDITTDAEPS